ncbi:hypothetical protein I3F54_09160, partial [Streptomyces sp. MUM 2J]|nr:hypothetical protein [Streptomyces sp. MUM 2J]
AGTGAPVSAAEGARGGPRGSGPARDARDAGACAPPPSRQRKRRRGSARFAGMVEGDLPPAPAPGPDVPDAPAAAQEGGRTPRGARFAGAAQETGEEPAAPVEPPDPAAGEEVAAVVAQLVRLRTQGRSGEAHALLVEAAHWPAARFPMLAAELQHAGLGADWATLLWEAVSLPAAHLVAAASALVAAGRDTDGQQMLRQGVVRPAAEIGEALRVLAAEGRRREIRALLDAYVRVRTPEEAVRSAAVDPPLIVPLLLRAAQDVSDERHWDLVHALRVAGLAT